MTLWFDLITVILGWVLVLVRFLSQESFRENVLVNHFSIIIHAATRANGSRRKPQSQQHTIMGSPKMPAQLNTWCRNPYLSATV